MNDREKVEKLAELHAVAVAALDEASKFARDNALTYQYRVDSESSWESSEDWEASEC